MIRQSCSTTEVQGSARHLSGKENYSPGKEGKPVLTGSAPVRWWWIDCAIRPVDKAQQLHVFTSTSQRERSSLRLVCWAPC